MKPRSARPALAALCLAALGALALTPARAQDIEKGKKLFSECAACHSIKPGETMIGPSLAGVFGRKAGLAESYRYSNALKRAGLTWDADTLGKYVADPQAFLPGNRMPYSGMPDEADRAALIAYLRTLQ